jgi:hypothetical protein
LVLGIKVGVEGTGNRYCILYYTILWCVPRFCHSLCSARQKGCVQLAAIGPGVLHALSWQVSTINSIFLSLSSFSSARDTFLLEGVIVEFQILHGFLSKKKHVESPKIIRRFFNFHPLSHTHAPKKIPGVDGGLS